MQGNTKFEEDINCEFKKNLAYPLLYVSKVKSAISKVLVSVV